MGYAPFVPHAVRRRCWRFTPTKADPCFGFLIDLVRSLRTTVRLPSGHVRLQSGLVRLPSRLVRFFLVALACRCTSRRTRFGTKRCTLQRKPRQAAWFRGKHQEPPKGTLRRPNPRLCQVVYMRNTICYRYSPISFGGQLVASQRLLSRPVAIPPESLLAQHRDFHVDIGGTNGRPPHFLSAVGGHEQPWELGGAPWSHSE